LKNSQAEQKHFV